MRLGHQRVDVQAEAHILSRYPDAHSLQIFDEEARVICVSFAATFRRRVVAWIFADQRAENDRGVGDSPRHWTSSVLAVRNWNDSGATHETDGWFDAHERVRRRRTNDRSVSLGADCSGAKICRDRCPRTRARAARISIQHVRVLSLTTTSAPAARRYG